MVDYLLVGECYCQGGQVYLDIGCVDMSLQCQQVVVLVERCFGCVELVVVVGYIVCMFGYLGYGQDVVVVGGVGFDEMLLYQYGDNQGVQIVG